MDELNEILNTDTVKEVIDGVCEEVEDIDNIVIGYTTKEGTLKWRTNSHRSQCLGIVDVIRQDLFNIEWE